MTINGSNFVENAAVNFGSVTASQVVVLSRTLITARTVAFASSGQFTVTVTNPDGRVSNATIAFTAQASASRTIEEAVLSNAAAVSDSTGSAIVKVPVAASVQAGTVTKGPGQGSGVLAKVGYATTVSTPPADADFTWADAAYAGDTDGPKAGDQLRDTYRGEVSLPGASAAAIDYTVAARFSIDDGVTWKIADRDGAANGTQKEQLSTVRVTKPSVDWCRLGGENIESPPAITLSSASPSGPVVYGQVYKQNVTNQSGPGPGLTGQLGYGAAGSQSSTWSWVDAAFAKKTGNGSNEEWAATLPNPGIGTYKYAYRFTANNGDWSYCDADGLANGGFTEAQAGTLIVASATVGSCNLQFPFTLEPVAGRTTAAVYGRVFVAGITDASGPGSGVEMQAGYGPVAAAPSASTWQWFASAFNVDVEGGGDEYRAAFTAPAAGTYGYAYRARVGTGPWSYCDRDGSGNGYDSASSGVMTVQSNAITSCKLETVSSFSIKSGDSLRASVSVGTQTSEQAGATAGLRVQIGVGPQGDNASSSTAWGWRDAAYTSDVSSRDVFEATVNPAYSGNRAVSARASVNDGGRWAYCDVNGSDGGYDPGAQYGVVVGEHTAISFCNTQFPSTVSFDAGATTVYGQIYEPSLTPDAGAPIRAEFGVGREAEDPGVAWQWRMARFFGVSGNNNEYAVSYVPAAGDSNYAFRYSKNNGVSWCYGDLNGNGSSGAGQAWGGFTGLDGNLGRVTP